MRLRVIGCTLLVSLGGLTACGWQRGQSSVDCISSLQFGSRTYIPAALDPSGKKYVVPAAHRHLIGSGVYPQCGPKSNHEPARRVSVSRIDGANVTTAVAVADGTVWLVSGSRALRPSLTPPG
jgi:hypothetical protein